MNNLLVLHNINKNNILLCENNVVKIDDRYFSFYRENKTNFNDIMLLFKNSFDHILIKYELHRIKKINIDHIKIFINESLKGLNIIMENEYYSREDKLAIVELSNYVKKVLEDLNEKYKYIDDNYILPLEENDKNIKVRNITKHIFFNMKLNKELKIDDIDNDIDNIDNIEESPDQSSESSLNIIINYIYEKWNNITIYMFDSFYFVKSIFF